MRSIQKHVLVAVMAGCLPFAAVAAGAPPSGSSQSGGTNMQGMDMQNMPGMDKAESFWFGRPAAKGARVDKTIVVGAGEFKYMPATITVKKGQTIEFKVVNSGKVRHEFVLADAQQQQEHEKEMAAMPNMKMNDPNGIAVEPGQTGILRWTFDKAGTLQYGCHEPGHFPAGMVGTLIVAP